MDKHLYMRGQGINHKLPVMFPTQIDAASTLEQCVINAEPQKECINVKRSMAGLPMSSKVACKKKVCPKTYPTLYFMARVGTSHSG
eukprot:5417921-Ditylum_brightwellii.AAC.1